MKDKTFAVEELRAEYIESKMASMIEDEEGGCDGSEMAHYARQGLEYEVKDYGAALLKELIQELADLEGDDEDEDED